MELRKELKDAKRTVTVATDRTFRPNAKDSSGRHGDWMCTQCAFRSNRAARSYCYRCTAPRGESHGTPQAVSPTGAVAIAVPPSSTSAASSTIPASSSSPAAHPPAMPAATSHQPPAGPEAAKAIRQRIAALEAARGALVGCVGCEPDRARLDQDLTAAKSSLAAHLPVEVAVKGTLGTATQARAAVTKAEAKVARLEVQLTAILDQYEAATAELNTSRAKLAEAEAATARAASVALPPEHYLAAVATDPGPFWSAFKSVIVQKCPGLPADFLGQLDNVTKAFEAVIEPIFRPADKQAEAASPPSAAPSSTSSSPTPPAPPPSDPIQQPAPQVPSAALPPAAPASAEDAISMAWQQQLGGGQASQPSAGQATQQQPQGHGMSTTSPSSVAAADAARAILAATAAAAAAPVEGAQLVDDAGNGVQGGGGGDGFDVGNAAPVNDPMGGGAAEGVVNKRSIAEVTSAARAIAAKAKAKSG